MTGVPSPWPAVLGALLASCAPRPARPPADDGWVAERVAVMAGPAPPPVAPVPLDQCGATEEGFEGWMASFRAHARARAAAGLDLLAAAAWALVVATDLRRRDAGDLGGGGVTARARGAAALRSPNGITAAINPLQDLGDYRTALELRCADYHVRPCATDVLAGAVLNSRPDSYATDRHAELRPILIAGMGVYWCGASAEFVKFAERLGAPVLTNTKCKGMIPEDHPLRAGCIIGGLIERKLVMESDLIITIGHDTIDESDFARLER